MAQPPVQEQLLEVSRHHEPWCIGKPKSETHVSTDKPADGRHGAGAPLRAPGFCCCENHLRTGEALPGASSLTSHLPLPLRSRISFLSPFQLFAGPIAIALIQVILNAMGEGKGKSPLLIHSALCSRGDHPGAPLTASRKRCQGMSAPVDTHNNPVRTPLLLLSPSQN